MIQTAKIQLFSYRQKYFFVSAHSPAQEYPARMFSRCNPCGVSLVAVAILYYPSGQSALVSMSRRITVMKSDNLEAPLSPALRFHTDTSCSSCSF